MYGAFIQAIPFFPTRHTDSFCHECRVHNLFIVYINISISFPVQQKSANFQQFSKIWISVKNLEKLNPWNLVVKVRKMVGKQLQLLVSHSIPYPWGGGGGMMTTSLSNLTSGDCVCPFQINTTAETPVILVLCFELVKSLKENKIIQLLKGSIKWTVS